MNYQLVLQYRGTRYQGWQKQPHTIDTIQGQLELAISKIAQEKVFKTIGSGRTDSGVHALRQYVLLESEIDIPADSLIRAINSFLPNDIKVIECHELQEQFHPVFSAKKKEYHYYFTHSEKLNPFNWDILTGLSFKPDLKLMNDFACELVGEHDFLDFSTKGTKVKSTLREIFSAEVVECLHPFDSATNCYCFKVVGSGFLKQMVRLMVSACWSYAQGKIELLQLREQLNNPTQQHLSYVAAPNGLFLVDVTY